MNCQTLTTWLGPSIEAKCQYLLRMIGGCSSTSSLSGDTGSVGSLSSLFAFYEQLQLVHFFFAERYEQLQLVHFFFAERMLVGAVGAESVPIPSVINGQ